MLTFYQQLIIFLALFLPFSFALNPTPTIDLNITKIIIPFIFIVWLYSALWHKKIFLDIRPQFWLLIIFLFFSGLSLLWTNYFPGAIRKIIFFLSTVPIIFPFYNAQKNKYFLPSFFKATIFSASLLASISLIPFVAQFFIPLEQIVDFFRSFITPFFLGQSLAELVNKYPSWLVNISGKTTLRTFGTFPDPHLFSLYLSMILPIAFYYQQQTKKFFYYLSVTIILAAIITGFSRASYLSVLTGGLFLFLNSQPSRIIKKNFLKILFLFNFILLCIIIPNSPISRFTSSFNIHEGSNQGRLAMWLVAIKSISEHPFLGSGLSSFGNNLDTNFGLRNPIYAHNLFLDFGAETGIINMTILVLLLISPVIYHSKLKQKHSPFSKYLATSFLIFLVHSLFETPFFSVHVFPLFLMLLSIENTKSSNNDKKFFH